MILLFRRSCAPTMRPLSSIFFFSSRRRHTRSDRDWSSDVCSSDLLRGPMKARLTWLEAVDPKGPEIAAMVEALTRRSVAVDPTLIASATKFRGDDREYTESP